MQLGLILQASRLILMVNLCEQNIIFHPRRTEQQFLILTELHWQKGNSSARSKWLLPGEEGGWEQPRQPTTKTGWTQFGWNTTPQPSCSFVATQATGRCFFPRFIISWREQNSIPAALRKYNYDQLQTKKYTYNQLKTKINSHETAEIDKS